MNPEITFPDTAETSRCRDTLLRRLIDYVALPASNIALQDRSMGGDILLDMLFHATDKERMLCARRLSKMNEAPRRILRYLAQCSIEIARPILEENEAFDDSDLADLIDQVSPEHQDIIARRKHVYPIVCDRLAHVAGPNTLRILLRNEGAQLSQNAVDVLVSRSRQEPDLCAMLIKRLEMRPAQAMAMFWWADGATRRIILQRQAADRIQMVEMCSDIFAMAAQESWRDPVSRKALQLIERRQRNRDAIAKSPYENLEGAIAEAARQGMKPELAQEIGYLAGVKPVVIAKILSDKGGEGLAVLCKATGLKRPYLKGLWVALKRHIKDENGNIDPMFKHVADTYEMLPVARAQTTLRYWNWSLSSTFSPNRKRMEALEAEVANDESSFSMSRRTAELVFGK